tara:strand:- start:3120 stop:3536 length:417 start_codon:yes stop_codon:yes gene_type:complete
MSWFDIIKRYKPDPVIFRQVLKELGKDSGYIELSPTLYEEVYERYMDKGREKAKEYYGQEAKAAFRKYVTSFAIRFKRNKKNLGALVGRAAQHVYSHKGKIGSRIFYANSQEILDKLGVQKKQENTLAQQRAYGRSLK